MREFKNNTSRHLSNEEFDAIMKAVKLLEEAFKKRMFQVSVNANAVDPNDVYGISMAFDLVQEGYR